MKKKGEQSNIDLKQINKEKWHAGKQELKAQKYMSHSNQLELELATLNKQKEKGNQEAALMEKVTSEKST